MTIICDIDNILNNLTEEALKLYNSRAGKSVELKDITSYNLSDCLPQEEANEIISLFKEEMLWNTLTPLSDSQDGIKMLLKQGHDIYLATSTDICNFEWKAKWLQQYFPLISSDNIIRIIDKSLLKCDVLIEDNLDNLISNTCERVCLDYPWNRSTSKDVAYNINRAYSWNDIVNIINKIEKEMMEW